MMKQPYSNAEGYRHFKGIQSEIQHMYLEEWKSFCIITVGFTTDMFIRACCCFLDGSPSGGKGYCQELHILSGVKSQIKISLWNSF